VNRTNEPLSFIEAFIALWCIRHREENVFRRDGDLPSGSPEAVRKVAVIGTSESSVIPLRNGDVILQSLKIVFLLTRERSAVAEL
jgi:hypothetical protein